MSRISKGRRICSALRVACKNCDINSLAEFNNCLKILLLFQIPSSSPLRCFHAQHFIVCAVAEQRLLKNHGRNFSRAPSSGKLLVYTGVFRRKHGYPASIRDNRHGRPFTLNMRTVPYMVAGYILTTSITAGRQTLNFPPLACSTDVRCFLFRKCLLIARSCATIPFFMLLTYPAVTYDELIQDISIKEC